MIPPDIQYLGIAPLSDCPFDPDIVTIICNPRQATMALRALQYYSGLAAIGETGPGTCSSSWVASYLTGEPRYTLGCHGVFGTMGIDPSEVCVSIPGYQVPTICEVLEIWREKGKLLFVEELPNEKRTFIQAPFDGPYRIQAPVQNERCEKVPEAETKDYISWEKRRKAGK
jgi:hypothetical protein